MKFGEEFIRKAEKRQSPVFSGCLALGLTAGTGFGILLVLGIEAIGGTHPFTEPSIIIGLVATLAALSSSFLALLALSEQQKSRQAGTDPVLVAHFTLREDARELIMLSISNVGAGAAMSVKIELTADFKPEDYEILTNVFSRHHPFRTILQGRSISFNFGLGFRLLGESPVPPFRGKINYDDIAGDHYDGEYILDIREMEKLGCERSLQHRQTVALEELGKSVAGIAEDQKTILARTQSLDEHRAEHKAEIKN